MKLALRVPRREGCLVALPGLFLGGKERMAKVFGVAIGLVDHVLKALSRLLQVGESRCHVFVSHAHKSTAKNNSVNKGNDHAF